MSIEINGVAASPARPLERPAPPVAPVSGGTGLPEQQEIDIRAAIQELDQVSRTFNRRLQYSINDKLNEVVVKVIDQQTDKVIKEIPPRELQIVHERIREALGLLFDERI